MRLRDISHEPGKTYWTPPLVFLSVVMVLLLLPLLALAEGVLPYAPTALADQFADAGKVIPRDALRYQRDLTRQSRAVWGMDAPVATFAAQIHQESRWRADAQSPAGAQGIAQFMPSTATWISGAYRMGEAQPYNPGWALRALVTYDKLLYEQTDAATTCDRMWKTLWKYNGGAGWVKRDERLAAKSGANPLVAKEVEPFNAGRSASNFAENRSYPRVILTRWQPVYAGWGGGVKCA